MNVKNEIRIDLVSSWPEEQIMQLYKAAGWWKEWMDENRIGRLIRGSFLFAVAISLSNGRAVGMGRVISDGVEDAYIQDLMVFDHWRRQGVGGMILARLLAECESLRISWIGIIAEPGKEDFYRSLGFAAMPGHIPMLYKE
jgi:GNAT superfamily N-acetyltransferase